VIREPVLIVHQALEALSGDRFFVVERMRFYSDRFICSVSIPICGWGSYIFPFVFLQVYFRITQFGKHPSKAI
jgi:hypothetical protein